MPLLSSNSYRFLRTSGPWCEGYLEQLVCLPELAGIKQPGTQR